MSNIGQLHRVEKVVHTVVMTYQNLDEEGRRLLEMAKHVRDNAQAPYSNYHVGVALITDSGDIFTGCNVERCSYTQTTHAEQNAIDSMVAAVGPQKISRLALLHGPKSKVIDLNVTPTDTLKDFDGADSPCGHCLQIIWENCLGDRNVEIIGRAQTGEITLTTIDSLLPVKFGPDSLGINVKG